MLLKRRISKPAPFPMWQLFADRNKGKIKLSFISFLECQNGILKKKPILWLLVAVCSGTLLESRNPLLTSEEDREVQFLNSCEAL